jgi:hypothetical protein
MQSLTSHNPIGLHGLLRGLLFALLSFTFKHVHDGMGAIKIVCVVIMATSRKEYGSVVY